MKTTINKTFTVAEHIEKVWANLSNPHEIVSCVPGASLTEQIDETNYKGEVTMKFGPVKASYDGQITFTEMDAVAHRMSMLGKGVDVKGKGGADMTMHISLLEIETGTEVTSMMEVTITGMLAQFGSRLITDVSNSVFDQFADNFRNKLAGGEVDNTMSAGAVVGSVVKGLFK